MVELDRVGRSPDELSRAFEPSAQAIRNRVARSDHEEGSGGDGLASAEYEELRQERKILTNFAA